MDHDNTDRRQFVHHRSDAILDYVREIVFGMQDGMVSTLGAITGIAIGSHDHFTVILSGIAIIAVESISMAIGSYLASSSQHHLNLRMMREAEWEMDTTDRHRQTQLASYFMRDGWSSNLATTMAREAARNRQLMLREVAYRHLGLIPGTNSQPIHNAIAMFLSYVLGGLMPLTPYFFLPVGSALPVSVILTLTGLFAVGATLTVYTGQHPLRTGLRVGILGGMAIVIGSIVGLVVPTVV